MTQIMGIVNATPDSFSGDGVMRIEDAVKQALQMIKDGADILDIGGESSRPGSVPVSAEEEIRRVVPVIETLRSDLMKQSGGIPLPLAGGARGGLDRIEQSVGISPPLIPPASGGEIPAEIPVRNILISIDTRKAVVADAALKAGANSINDISALGDPEMAEVAVRHQCRIVLMHNRSKATDIQHDAKLGAEYSAGDYVDVVEDVKRDLMQRVEIAQASGIATDKIILDPGIGFGKSVEQNLALIRGIPELKKLGFPILIGASRKNFIGKILDAPVDERLEGDAAITVISTYLGADIIRVHDVKLMAQVEKMSAAIKRL